MKDETNKMDIFANDIFKWISLKENDYIYIWI